MKKTFILATAVIIALASCAKSEVVYTDAPQEIAFKQITGVMTKAEQIGTELNGSLGAFAVVHEETDLYFTNKEFTMQNVGGVNYWKGVTTQFWPLDDNLGFVVYAPYAIESTVGGSNYPSYDPAGKVLAISADNSTATSINDQTDYLYGANYYDCGGLGYDKTTSSVPVVLKHAMAKVTISFTGANVTIVSAQIDSPTLAGTYTVDYDPSVAVDWTPASAALTPLTFATLAYTGLTATAAAESFLVVPETKSDLSFTYRIAGSETDLSYTIPVTSNWLHGKHYVYNVKIDPKEIMFTTEVSGWGDSIEDTKEI